MAPGEPHFVPRRSRRWLGPLFGAVCLLATTIGVVVLGVLIVAIFAAVARGASAEGVPELLGRLWRSMRSVDPDEAGFRVGIVGSLWPSG